MILDTIHRAKTPISQQRFNFEVNEFSGFDKIEIEGDYLYAAKFLYKSAANKNKLILKSISETKENFYCRLDRYKGELGLILNNDDFGNEEKTGYFIPPITVTENTVIYFKGSDIKRATINDRVDLKEVRPYTMGLTAFKNKYL